MMAGPSHYILPRPVFEAPAPRLLIVRAPYYVDIADALLQGARAECDAAGAVHDLFDVPGALELPPAVRQADRSGDYDGFVVLGCVIRGETTHYETVCNDSSQGLMQLGLAGLCIGNGILTVENYEQAAVRADPAQMNKGGGAAAAALHLIALARKWGNADKGVGFTREILLAGKPDNAKKA